MFLFKGQNPKTYVNASYSKVEAPNKAVEDWLSSWMPLVHVHTIEQDGERKLAGVFFSGRGNAGIQELVYIGDRVDMKVANALYTGISKKKGEALMQNKDTYKLGVHKWETHLY